MRSSMLIFLLIFFTIYAIINYYIGLRGFQAFYWIHPRLAYLWAAAVALLSFIYPVGRSIAEYLPPKLVKVVIYSGSYWLAAMFYLLIILLVSDLIRLVVRKSDLLPPQMRGYYNLVLLGIFLLVVVILVYGTWNSRHPVIRDYQITLNQKSSTLKDLNVVMVSDIHLGWIVGIDRLQQMTELVNAQNPDLVLFAGDIIDEGVKLDTEQEMPAVLQALHPRLGSYAVMGNHEYISGNAEATIGFLNRAGINVLRDQVYEITNGFYLVGRDDASRHRFNGSQRQDLATVMAKVDSARLPVILMDHEPSNLEEAVQSGVDLQFSGHTHLGQVFPANYITHAVFENDWGLLQKETLQVIVSCGYGTWGPPIRIGNHPEIVRVLVHFAPEAEKN
jgi:predicted MPP superfamily phosphohydrolase